MTQVFPVHRRLALLTILLLAIGLVLLFSASAVLGLQRYHSEFYYVFRQLLGVLLGMAVLFWFSQLHYSWWKRVALPLILIQVILLVLIHLGIFKHHAMGASRWLKIGPLIFQPSELAKISLAVYCAWILERQSVKRIPPKGWVILLLPIVLTLLLILKQPDLGSTILLTAMLLAVLFIAGMRPLFFFGSIAVGALGFLFLMLNSDYRRRRLMTFLNPWLDPQGNGFQVIQSFLSFHSGSLSGVGLGNGSSKLFFLPEVHTDFIFSLLGEELGFAGTITLLLLFTYFSYLAFKIPYRAKDRFSCYLSLALAIALTMQILVNLGGVTGLLPLKGLPLPFLSWGRSALIVNLAMVGILLNISKQSEIIRPNEDES